MASWNWKPEWFQWAPLTKTANYYWQIGRMESYLCELINFLINIEYPNTRNIWKLDFLEYKNCTNWFILSVIVVSRQISITIYGYQVCWTLYSLACVTFQTSSKVLIKASKIDLNYPVNWHQGNIEFYLIRGLFFQLNLLPPYSLRLQGD